MVPPSAELTTPGVACTFILSVHLAAADWIDALSRILCEPHFHHVAHAGFARFLRLLSALRDSRRGVTVAQGLGGDLMRVYSRVSLVGMCSYPLPFQALKVLGCLVGDPFPTPLK